MANYNKNHTRFDLGGLPDVDRRSLKGPLFRKKQWVLSLGASGF